MSPMLQEALGSIIRWGLTILSGYIIKAGIWTEQDAAKYVMAASLAVLTLSWSLWQKYKSRLKLLISLATSRATTEKYIEECILAGESPSVNTPKNMKPTLG